MQPIWPLLGASYPPVAWPSLRPRCPLETLCNLWCWEITGAGRPGRHTQLDRAPPVRWGHSQPQTDTLISPPPPTPKLQAFHSFFKGCTSRYSTMRFSAQCPLKSMRIVEYVYTWGRWTEHPDRCVLHTICSTWLGKHLMAYYGVMWLATSQRLWAVESVIQNLQKCTRNKIHHCRIF